MRKSVSDLGIAAYLMMHGYKTVGRRGRQVFFEVEEKEAEEMSRLTMEYLRSQYSQFDSCLMGLKNVVETPAAVGRPVSDLGIGAYVMLHGYKVLGRKGKVIFFEVAEKDDKEFVRLQIEYLGGTFHQFDAYLMGLKKCNDLLLD